MIQAALRPAIDRAVPARDAVRVAVGTREYDAIRESVATEGVEYTITPLTDPEFNRRQAEPVRELFARRMRELPSADFAELLRSAMREDEWLLVLHGAVLGFGGGAGAPGDLRSRMTRRRPAARGARARADRRRGLAAHRRVDRGDVAQRRSLAAGRASRAEAAAAFAADEPRRERTLRERGAELLARSADVDYEEAAHPAYARILDELAPDEARILRFLQTEGAQPAVDVRTAKVPLLSSELVAPGLSMIGAGAGVPLRGPRATPTSTTCTASA